MCKSCSNFTTINVQTALSNIFDFSFNLWIPLCKIMNPLPNLIKRHITLLPFRHLENLQISQYFPNFLIVLLYIIMRNTKILMNLLIHFTTNTAELNRMRYYRTNIRELLWFVLCNWTAFYLCWNTMDTLDYVDHVLESILNVIL